MVRRYDEVIEVRETSTNGPGHFLWRGRIYAVRSVLGHWRERRAWWLEGATARLLGLDPAESSEPERDAQDVLEREIWRVEAGAGRSAVVGVYDLGRDVLDQVRASDPVEDAETVGARANWRLLQVAD